MEVLLMDSRENLQTVTYQRNLQIPQDRTPSTRNLWGQDGRKREVVRGGQGPRILWRGEKHCIGEN